MLVEDIETGISYENVWCGTFAHSSHANLLSPSRTSTFVNLLKHSRRDVLATGCLSPRKVLLSVRDRLALRDKEDEVGDDGRELRWRCRSPSKTCGGRLCPSDDSPSNFLRNSNRSFGGSGICPQGSNRKAIGPADVPSLSFKDKLANFFTTAGAIFFRLPSSKLRRSV